MNLYTQFPQITIIIAAVTFSVFELFILILNDLNLIINSY